jgi:hypothetical protein
MFYSLDLTEKKANNRKTHNKFTYEVPQIDEGGNRNGFVELCSETCKHLFKVGFTEGKWVLMIVQIKWMEWVSSDSLGQSQGGSGNRTKGNVALCNECLAKTPASTTTAVGVSI